MNSHPFELKIEQLETINKDLETLKEQEAKQTVGGFDLASYLDRINPTTSQSCNETGCGLPPSFWDNPNPEPEPKTPWYHDPMPRTSPVFPIAPPLPRVV